MSKTVVITQSNYLPWRGYFDLISRADELILLDSVQFTRRDWRNRNQIKTARGTEWLTIAVQSKGAFEQAIEDTRIADLVWSERHIRTIEANYRRAAAYETTAPWLYELLRDAGARLLLSGVNRRLISAICTRLGITTAIRSDREVCAAPPREMDATDRLLLLAKESGADRYLSGPAAKDYLDVARFKASGIAVEWMSYEGYSPYPQCWGAFEPHVSIADLLLNCGNDAPRYLHAVD